MKRIQTFIGFILLSWILSCTRITEQEPSKVPFEKQTGPLPLLNVSVDSVQLTQTIRFDTIAQGGNFSVQFTKLSFGKIRIVEDGKAVQLVMDTGRWEKDSTQYTICKNTVCRDGWLKIKNKSYRPVTVDTTDTVTTDCIQLATRTLFVNFSTSLFIKQLFPTGKKGTILADSLKTIFYTVSKTSDSSITFIANPIAFEPMWAWDTIRYQATGSNGQCYKGKIAIVLGNTCEPQARDDVFTVPTGTVIWPETTLTANGTGCTGQTGSYQTRTPFEAPMDWDYGNYKVMNTKSGVLIDTLISGTQHYKYRRSNAAATEDGFWYYYKNLSSGRVTKAWVRIQF